MQTCNRTAYRCRKYFKIERDKLAKDGKNKQSLKGLELKFKFNQETEIQLKNTFVHCV